VIVLVAPSDREGLLGVRDCVRVVTEWAKAQMAGHDQCSAPGQARILRVGALEQSGNQAQRVSGWSPACPELAQRIDEPQAGLRTGVAKAVLERDTEVVLLIREPPASAR
jgi:hypothetical protein